MTTHTPTAVDQIYTCDQCTFRAVLTTRSLFVLDPGDDKQQHLDAITADRQARREWVYRTVTRIRQRYSDGVLLPRTDGRHVFPCEEVKTGMCVCAHQDRYRLSLAQTQRLVRCVMMEYGNE